MSRSTVFSRGGRSGGNRSVWRSKEEIGHIVREVRERMGMTQQELARHLGSPGSQSQVSHWERGRHRPSVATLRKIAGLAGDDLSLFQRPSRVLSLGEGAERLTGSTASGLGDSLPRLEEGLLPDGSEALVVEELSERLLAVLLRRAGLRRVARILVTENLLDAACGIALEDGWSRADLKRLDRLRDDLRDLSAGRVEGIPRDEMSAREGKRVPGRRNRDRDLNRS